jgi:hypothetical protein
MRRDLKITVTDADLFDARIGGPSIFPYPDLVPFDRHSKRMRLLLSFPIKRVDPTSNIDAYCSVFFPFDNESLEHLDLMADVASDKSAGSSVFIHMQGSESYDLSAFDTPKKLEITCDGGAPPDWVQSEIKVPGHDYFCEIYFGADFNKSFPNFRGAFGGSVGYLFIRKDWKLNENCGALLLQDS